MRGKLAKEKSERTSVSKIWRAGRRQSLRGSVGFTFFAPSSDLPHAPSVFAGGPIAIPIYILTSTEKKYVRTGSRSPPREPTFNSPARYPTNVFLLHGQSERCVGHQESVLGHEGGSEGEGVVGLSKKEGGEDGKSQSRESRSNNLPLRELKKLLLTQMVTG